MKTRFALALQHGVQALAGTARVAEKTLRLFARALSYKFRPRCRLKPGLHTSTHCRLKPGLRAAAAIVGLNLLFGTEVFGAGSNPNQYVLPTNAIVGDKTIGEWTAEWWKWIYSLPTNQNPNLDTNGAHAHFGQSGPVFFVPGGPPNVSGEPLTLTYSVPENTHLLVPIATAQADNIDVEPPLSVEQLRDLIAVQVQTVTELHAVLDGVSVPFIKDSVSGFFNHRTLSPVFSFNFTNPDNFNTFLYGHPITNLVDPIVGDGYWLMLKPLPLGEHELQTGTTLGFPSFSRSLIHKITVVPNPNEIVLPTNAIVVGKNIGEWSAEWYKAFMPCPTNGNPLRDLTGADALNCQPDGPVLFLAGVQFGDLRTATRRFTIPEDKHLFFPLLNVYAGDPTDCVPVPCRRDAAAAFINTYTELHASIDGVAITNLPGHRAQSPVFSIAPPSCDNMFTVNNGYCITNLDDLVADGFYLMVAPLPLGEHVINFGGTLGPPFNFRIDITEFITVVPAPTVWPTNAVVGGKTLSEWTEQWWKWVFSIPTNQNPHLDTTGRWAHLGQPDASVFFLSGHSGLTPDAITRSFTVPEGKSLLMPVLVAQNDNIDVFPPLPTEEVINGVVVFLNDPRELHATIDGVNVPNLRSHRALSPVFNFEFTNPDNVKSFNQGHPITGLVDPIISDGYWLMLRPLPIGSHVLRYGGAFRLPFFFTNDVIAHITVVSDPNQYVLPTDAVVDGKTIDDWTAEWWKWAYATPTNQNPLLDPDGSRAHNGQPGGDVFFIATPSGLVPGPVVRTFSVPDNKYLLLNLLPVSAECIDTPPDLCSVEILRDGLAGIIANPQELHASIDGVAVTNLLAHRAISPVFRLSLPDADNLKTLQYGHPVTGEIDPNVSDGYWLLIKPLPPGQHALNFGGAWNQAFGYFPVDTTAYINVVPDANQYVIPTNAVVAGKTISEWTAEWWKWIFPAPTNQNPLLETNGLWAHFGQPDGEVFFIAGASGLSPDKITRTFTVPENKYLFVPVLPVEVDNFNTFPPLSVEDLREQCSGLVANPRELHASIDGIAITNLLAHRADSPVFNLFFTNSDNFVSFNYATNWTGLVDPMLACGYWLMIKPLPLGPHVLNFGSTTANEGWHPTDITANINVVPEPLTHVMPTNAVIGEKSIADWSAEWWKWAFSVPTNRSPLLDVDGSWANEGQPPGDVFFLGGVVWQGPTATRAFTVPEGNYLFFPVLNVWTDNVYTEPPFTLEQLRDSNAAYMNAATNLFATLDGIALPNLYAHRAIAPVFSIHYDFIENIHNFIVGNPEPPILGTIDPVASDGYWVMLEPLSPGTHTLNFGGTIGSPLNLSFGITNIITVSGTSTNPQLPDLTSTNVLTVACPPTAPIQPSSIAREDFWVPDGPLNAVVETNGVLYVAGLFDYVSPNSLTGGAFDQVSGAPVPGFPKVNGAIKAVEPDRAGGWFVGGIFNSVGDYALTNLAHIRADGTVDTTWTPNPDGAVLTMVTSPDKLYVGGTFKTIGGQPRSLLAALAIDTGAVRPFRADATTSFPKPSVTALALSGNTLYLAGYFSFINGAEREHLGAVDAETGAVTAWHPNGYTGSQAGSRIDALAILRNTLFVGGTFTSIGGAQTNGPLRNFIAALDVNGGDFGASVLPWDPNANGPVTSLAVFCDTLYVGGAFTRIGGQPRNRIAAINVFTGQATDWNPNANNDVLSLRISGSTVYAGGKFTQIGGEPREFLAALDLNSGRAELWNPKADFGVAGLAVAGGTVYGGGFVAGGGKLRKNIAAFDVRTGEPTDWAPQVTGETLINAFPFRGVYALAATADTLYLGGPFTHINGQPRSHAGAINLSSGGTTSWNPSPNGIVETLAVSGSTVFLGGRFSQIEPGVPASAGGTAGEPDALVAPDASPAKAGTPYFGAAASAGPASMGRTNIAAVDAITGVPSNWNPGANDKIKTLAVCDNAVFAGGLFTAIGGSPHNRLAALDINSGLAFNWNPSVSDQVSAISLSSGEVYFGGQFSTVNGQARNRAAAWNLDAGAVTCWTPNARTVVNGVERSAAINAMLPAGNTVFVCGSFNLIAGQARNNLAALSTNCPGTATSWNPDADGPVLALAASGNTLFAAGGFQNMGGQFRPHLAVFPPEGAPRIAVQPRNEQVGIGVNVVFAAEAAGDGALSFQWQFNGTNISGATSSSLSIADAQVSHSGEYRVVVTNSLGLVHSRAATLTVLDPVRILVQPADQFLRPGNTLRLAVVARGNPAPVYQWRLNGVNIPGAIFSSFVVSNAQPTDGGSYSVVVANIGGAISSEIATVRIASPALPFEDDLSSVIEDDRPGRGRRQSDIRSRRFHRGSIRAASGMGSGDNRTATAESGEPNHAGKPGGHSLWLSWIAPDTGVAVFNTRGSDFDTLLAIYTGTNVVSDEDRGGFATSQAAFNAVAGTEYLIAVDGLAGAAGHIVLSWNLDTSTAEIPRIDIQPQSQTIFAGQDVTFVVNAASATPAAYQWFFNCELIPGATNASLGIPMAQYEQVGTYRVRVMNASRYVTESQDAFLEIGPQPDVLSQDKLEDLLAAVQFGAAPVGLGGPANFSAAGAPGGILLASLGTIDSQVLDNTTATTSLRETNHCGVLGGASKWLGVRPTASGVMQVDTIGSAIDTVLAVYTGTSLLNLREVACDNNSAPESFRSLVRFNAVSGTDYLLAVDGVNGAKGAISLNWKYGQVPRVIVVGTNMSVREGGGFELGISAFSHTPDLQYQWRLNGINIVYGTNGTFSVLRALPAHAGTYSVVVQNFAGSVTSVVAVVQVTPPIRIGYALTNGYFHVIDPSGQTYVIEGSMNLIGWQPLWTNSANTASPVIWIDPQSPALGRRFYRVSLWP